MRKLTATVALLLAAALGACTHRAPNTGFSAGNVISRADIERVRAKTVLDAVQRIRPDALTRRAAKSVLLDGQSYPVVFLNAQYYGRIDELRNMSADDVEEIRIFGNADAVTKFGAQYGGGVIQLISRSGS